MGPQQSVSEWIALLKAGEHDAAQKLWSRYQRQLLELARRKLADKPKQAADEEDVAQSVFLVLCTGATNGRFEDVRNRDELWWLLLAITRQKSVDLVRRETAAKRGGGIASAEHLQADGGLDCRSLDDLVGKEPTPDFLVMLEEQNQRLLGLLRDDRLRTIAMARIEGYTVAEIATDLGVSVRSVERKLQLIRNSWSKELLGGD